MWLAANRIHLCENEPPFCTKVLINTEDMIAIEEVSEDDPEDKEEYACGARTLIYFRSTSTNRNLLYVTQPIADFYNAVKDIK